MTRNGETALHYAVAYSSLEVALLVIKEKTANLKLRNK